MAKGNLKKLYQANKTYLADEMDIIKMIDEYLVNHSLKRMANKSTLFHPSRISKGIECERYWYFMFTNEVLDIDDMFKREAFTARTLKIMEIGTGIHWAFHHIFYEMGILEGVWKCCYCDQKFWATSPTQCPECLRTVNWDHLIFKEVPFESQFIAGHADGILNLHKVNIPARFFLELKSIKNILEKSASKHVYGFESLEQPLEEHDLQLQLYMDEWQQKVKDSQFEEKLIPFADEGHLRVPNNAPDIIGAREIGKLDKGLIMYVGKNTGELKVFATKLNQLKIKFLKESMAKIFEAVAAEDLAAMSALCYTQDCQKNCRFGDKCSQKGMCDV